MLKDTHVQMQKRQIVLKMAERTTQSWSKSACLGGMFEKKDAPKHSYKPTTERFIL